MFLFAYEVLESLKELLQVNKIKNKYVRNTIYCVSCAIIFAMMRRIYFKLYRKYYHLPNGPIGFPLIGSMYQFVSNFKKFMINLSKYGPVTHYAVLGLNFVIINDYKFARKLCSDERLLNRPSWDNLAPSVKDSVTFSNGKQWSETRTLIYSSFSKLANKSFIDKIVKQILDEHTFVSLDKLAKNNEIWFPWAACRHVSFNTIFGAIFGKILALDSNIFEKINDQLNKTTRSFGFITISPAFLQPMFALIVESNTLECISLWKSFCEEQFNSYDPNDLKTWFHCIIHEMSAINNSKNNTQQKNIHELNITEKDRKLLNVEVFELLIAGIDTAGYTMEYGVLILAKYPKCQQMIFEELNNKFENKQSFQLSKLNECPILRAFVIELLRNSMPSPIGLPRAPLFDCQIEITQDNITDEYANFIGKKYSIPKNFNLIFNHRYFSKSEIGEFNINNFLKFDEINKTYKFDSNHPNIFPLSIGKRSCAGENIAMAELHIFFAQLVLNYKIKSTVKEETMKINSDFGNAMVITPKVGVKVERR